jgi:hypothetical protein
MFYSTVFKNSPKLSGTYSDERGDGVPDNHGDARGILEKARNYSSDRVARVFWQC